jgi:chemotaxis protein methyltransferase CheR
MLSLSEHYSQPISANMSILSIPDLHVFIPDVHLYDETFLQNCIQKRIQALQCEGLESYRLLLDHHQEERLHLQKSLQVSYSEFFRNSLTFSVLEKVVLPEMIQHAILKKQSKLRFWSMACASGQEVYSLAMLLEESLERQKVPFHYQVFATDQSKTEIAFASSGCYSATELANVSLKRLNRWFTRTKEGYEVKDELRKNIHFSVFDVVSDQNACPPESIFGDFDLILCANLLFYYQSESQETILQKAQAVLSKGGFLVTGEVERAIVKQQWFKESYPNAAIFTKYHE